MNSPATTSPLLFFSTPPHACSYLPERTATTVFADPNCPKSTALYSVLSEYGFRRSGQHIYRPNCEHCHACVAVRVDVNAFRPRRSQRRNLALNRDLTVTGCDAAFRADHFALYRHYIAARHPGGGMDNPTPRSYLDFLTSPWSRTMFVEFRLADRLVAVSVVDRLRDGLSAVYTFFDTRLSDRGLGIHAVLWEIEEARRQGLRWLYLGYWIADSAKMDYKRAFLPQDRFIGGAWQRVDAGD